MKSKCGIVRLMARTLDAILFDLDGTLADTREFIFQAFERVLESYGHPVPGRSAMMAKMGLPLAECYAAFAPEDGADIAALCAAHDAFQHANLGLVEGYDGLIDTLDALRAAGYKIGVCTDRGEHVFAALGRAGIASRCDVLVHGKLVAKPKPDPEGILKALGQLSIEPARAAMVGDTRVDIEAGKNSGLALTVGLTHGFGARETLSRAGADRVVDSLPEILPIFLDA